MTFKNVGIVEFAEIDLKGLTILTGLNDTGKSFISKSIYAAIKTIKDSYAQDTNDKFSQLDSYWVGIRGLLNTIKQPPRPEISTLFEKMLFPLRAEVMSNISNKAPIDNTISKIRHSQIEILQFEEIPPNIKANIDQFFKAIINLLETQKREKDIRVGYFNSIMIQQLFRSQFNSLINSGSQLSMSWSEGGNEILRLISENNKAVNIAVDDSFFGLLHFIDATIIDSPILLQLNALILKNRLDANRPQLLTMPIYYADLVSKFIPVSNPVNPEINNVIKGIIGGTVVYEVKSNKILFIKNNGQAIESYNIANGIKSFGAIQMLLTAGSIHKNSILIIDEPEVHLHPKWIIEYANIIVELATADIPLVISSHSPYLIEALAKFCKPIKEKTKFYWGEQHTNGMSIFNDVTENLEPIFKALAAPMKALSFYV